VPEAIPNPVEPPGDTAELRAQLDRLRDQLATALDAARAAELAAGALRGELAEMRVQLARARQEQEWAMTARHVRSARWRASASSTMTRARDSLARRLRR
jgi:predicted  nucleic acid-binding Zn-ribbon protein